MQSPPAGPASSAPACLAVDGIDDSHDLPHTPSSNLIPDSVPTPLDSGLAAHLSFHLFSFPFFGCLPLCCAIWSYSNSPINDSTFDASDECDASPYVSSCVLCGKVAKTVSTLWQHVNSVHISRGCFTPLHFFQRFDCFLCSDPSCCYVYLKQWSVCQHSLGGPCKCGSVLVDPLSKPDLVPVSVSLSPPSDLHSMPPPALSAPVSTLATADLTVVTV